MFEFLRFCICFVLYKEFVVGLTFNFLIVIKFNAILVFVFGKTRKKIKFDFLD